jgi:hypothetical protein
MLNTPQRVKFAVTLNSNHAVATSARRSSTTAVAIHCPRQFQEGFSQDGNAISTALGHYTIPLRSIDRDAGRGAAAQRFQISFQGFAELMARERDRPGRELILCVSPGWPPLFGLKNLRDASLREQVFGTLSSSRRSSGKARSHVLSNRARILKVLTQGEYVALKEAELRGFATLMVYCYFIPLTYWWYRQGKQ